MPDIEHHVLVDRSDLEFFKRFETQKRRIIDCSQVLPSYREFTFWGKRLWWRWPTKIVRGWIYQQLIKIAYVKSLETDCAVVVDSDAIFLRKIEPSDLFIGDRLKVYHCPGKSSGPQDQSPKWHNVAARSFGLREQGYTGADYISTAVIWSPAVLRQMVSAIETLSGAKWDHVLTQDFRFSEYVLYGVFCEHVAGPHQDAVEASTDELCHCSWDYDINTDEGVALFRDGLKAHHCAVLIQSNLGMPDIERASILEKFELSSPGT
jgi:hypothetical protein